jgi:hypothetical protein
MYTNIPFFNIGLVIGGLCCAKVPGQYSVQTFTRNKEYEREESKAPTAPSTSVEVHLVEVKVIPYDTSPSSQAYSPRTTLLHPSTRPITVRLLDSYLFWLRYMIPWLSTLWRGLIVDAQYHDSGITSEET